MSSWFTGPEQLTFLACLCKHTKQCSSQCSFLRCPSDRTLQAAGVDVRLITQACNFDRGPSDFPEHVSSAFLITCNSLNVGLHAQPPEISEQQFDEEVGLLWVSHPQDAAAVPCDGVIPTRCEPVTNMQRLHADTHSYAIALRRQKCPMPWQHCCAGIQKYSEAALRGQKALHLQIVWLLHSLQHDQRREGHSPFFL